VEVLQQVTKERIGARPARFHARHSRQSPHAVARVTVVAMPRLARRQRRYLPPPFLPRETDRASLPAQAPVAALVQRALRMLEQAER
jgi:hypothetical protein